MARTGRPASKNPLKYDIKVRLDEDTFQKLNTACEKTGTERATFIREAVRSQLGLEAGTPAAQPGLPAGETKRLGPPAKSPVIKGGKDGVTRLVGEAKNVAPAVKRPAVSDASEPEKPAKKPAPVNKKIDVFLL